MITVEACQQVMSLLPLDPLLPGALPPERRAALELRMAQLRAAPRLDRTSRTGCNLNSIPVSTDTGQGQLLLTFSGWVRRHQQDVIELLIEENRVLKERVMERRLQLTEDQRRRLTSKGKRPGRRVLGAIVTVVTPGRIASVARHGL